MRVAWMLLTLVLVAGRRLMRGWCREMNITAMRLGPGKHLKGRTLMGGVVTPEEFDYFHEVSTSRASLAAVPRSRTRSRARS